LKIVLAAARITAIGQTTLAHHFGARMAARGRGGIILVGSLSGNAGTPTAATYSAAKAYSQIFAEALWCELKPRGIDVLSLVLGITDTPARMHSGVPKADIPGWPVLAAADVAQQALDNLADGGPVHVPPQYAQMFQYLCSTPRRQIAECIDRAQIVLSSSANGAMSAEERADLFYAALWLLIAQVATMFDSAIEALQMFAHIAKNIYH